ncbi:MAG: hypothetical protein ACREMA_11195, partial [Longimicrobiales bacterium]
MKTAYRIASRAKRRNIDLMHIVKNNVATLTVNQQDHLKAPYQAAIDALQFGGFNEHHWRNLADGFNIAEELAGMNLANDHADKFDAAQKELFALSEQFRDRKSWTARAAQLQVIKDAMEIHEI